MSTKLEPVAGFFDESTQKLVAYEGLDGHRQDMPGSGSAPVESETSVKAATSFDLNGASGEVLQIKQLSELVTIAAAASSETVMDIPAGVIVLAVPVRVTTVIPTATTFDVGSGADADRFAASVAVAANTTSPGTLAGAYYNATATPVTITPSVAPAAATGRVRVTIFYIEVTPPTS